MAAEVINSGGQPLLETGNHGNDVASVSDLQPQQPIIIQMAPAPHNYIQPIPTVIQAAPIRSIGAPMAILPPGPPNKLPLPRTYTPASCSTGLVNVYNTPVVASQPWRLPKVFLRTYYSFLYHLEFSGCNIFFSKQC